MGMWHWKSSFGCGKWSNGPNFCCIGIREFGSFEFGRLFGVPEKKFFDGFEELEHIGSMYTIRTVLKNREHDDARPTLVGKDNKIYTLFSGKIDTCVDASNNLIRRIKNDTN